jgi:hypothetical protein
MLQEFRGLRSGAPWIRQIGSLQKEKEPGLVYYFTKMYLLSEKVIAEKKIFFLLECPNS